MSSSRGEARRGAGFLAAFGVLPGEARAVGPALVYAFLCIGASTLAAIGADSLFVSTFSLGELSRFLVLSSSARVVVAVGLAALAGRSTGPRFDAFFLAGSAAVLGASGVLGQLGSRALIYAACMALALIPPLLPLIAFNGVISCFHARQAKRLLPLVAAAATVGSMAAGASAKIFAARIGAGSLLLVGAALCLGALPFPGILDRRAVAAAGSRPHKPAPPRGALDMLAGMIRDLRAVRVVRLVVGVAVLSAAAVNLVDFAFKASLKATYGRDEMAAFMGSFSLLANAVVLVAQLFFASRFVGRYGVRASLTAFPVALVFLGPLLGLVPGVRTAVTAKLAEQIFRYALGGSTGDLILTPAPAGVRTRAKLAVKGIAAPAGALGAGIALSLFGEAGPSMQEMGVLLIAAGAIGIVVVRGARRAYAEALGDALGAGSVPLDVSATSGALIRNELCRLLAERAADGDLEGTRRILMIMSDRLFSLEDVEPVLRVTIADPASRVAIRRALYRTAIQLARPGEGDRLLAALPADDDPAIERETLGAARALGAEIPRARLDRAVAEGSRVEDAAHADLWADALVALRPHAPGAALPALRRAAEGPDSPRRAAALRGLGLLGDARAEKQVLRALASDDAAVFAEAAAAAVRINAQGAIETLVSRLSTGPHIRAAARALALAGPRAVSELVAALPTTRGERQVLATAIVSGRSMAGTVRAARVLARLGPEACARALARFGDLGYRARDAIAHAFAAVSLKTSKAIDHAVVHRAMELTVGYAETLLGALATARPGLLELEIRHRIGETGARVLDLASTMGDRPLIARARIALSRGAHERENALELLENVLPRGLAARTVALLAALAEGGPPARRAKAEGRAQVKFDGWLEKCAEFDGGTLRPGDPMISVLEKVLVLRDSSLFEGLSGEELFPVAEIAELVTTPKGAAAVNEGDPGDALFVVMSGRFAIVKGGDKLRAIERGEAFGELSLLDGAPRAASVIAEIDGQLLRVPRAEFEALLDESPELARGVIRTLIGHIRRGA